MPALNTQLEKTELAVDRSLRQEMAAEAVYTPSLTPIPRERMREEPVDLPPKHAPELARPFIPIDPFGGEAEYSLDPSVDPKLGPRGATSKK